MSGGFFVPVSLSLESSALFLLQQMKNNKEHYRCLRHDSAGENRSSMYRGRLRLPKRSYGVYGLHKKECRSTHLPYCDAAGICYYVQRLPDTTNTPLGHPVCMSYTAADAGKFISVLSCRRHPAQYKGCLFRQPLY